MGDPSLLSMTPEQSPVRELSGDRQDPPETSASFRAMRRLSFSEEQILKLRMVTRQLVSWLEHGLVFENEPSTVGTLGKRMLNFKTVGPP